MKNFPFDLWQLKVFVAVAKLKTLRSAAKILGITPSAVSQHLSALEDDLGESLFERDARPMRLTPVGRRLLIDGSNLLRAAERVRARITASNMSFSSLRLGIGESATATISPWLLQSLFSHVAELSVHTELTQPLVAKLIDDQLDVILCAGVMPHGEQWLQLEAYQEEYLLVQAKSLPLLTTKAQLRSAVEDHPFFTYTEDSSDRHRVQRLLGAMDISPGQQIPVSSSYALVGQIALTGGIGILTPTNLWCGQHFVSQVNFGLLPDGISAKRDMWVVGNRDRCQEQVELVKNSTQSVMKKYMIHSLDALSPGLSSYVYLSSD